ncbi:zinc-binding dehydrogenase [Actinomadura vinacea]|uniref:zinc-binding dehydrogenase n=1 Tax=Actinomadura vinacea TaxID=115336 RepID=UPI003CD0873D
MVRQAGAHDVILYTEQDFAEATLRLTDGHGADLIIDAVGASTFAGNLQAAALRGHIVIFGAASSPADPFHPTCSWNAPCRSPAATCGTSCRPARRCCRAPMR